MGFFLLLFLVTVNDAKMRGTASVLKGLSANEIRDLPFEDDAETVSKEQETHFNSAPPKHLSEDEEALLEETADLNATAHAGEPEPEPDVPLTAIEPEKNALEVSMDEEEYHFFNCNREARDLKKFCGMKVTEAMQPLVRHMNYKHLMFQDDDSVDPFVKHEFESITLNKTEYKIETVNRSPTIYVIDDFLTLDEAESLKSKVSHGIPVILHPNKTQTTATRMHLPSLTFIDGTMLGPMGVEVPSLVELGSKDVEDATSKAWSGVKKDAPSTTAKGTKEDEASQAVDEETASLLEIISWAKNGDFKISGWKDFGWGGLKEAMDPRAYGLNPAAANDLGIWMKNEANSAAQGMEDTGKMVDEAISNQEKGEMATMECLLPTMTYMSKCGRALHHVMCPVFENAVEVLNEKLDLLTNTEAKNRVTPRIVHFRHHDFQSEFIEQGPGIAMAIYVFLNDVDQGGDIYFPYIDVRVQPKAGRAVLFNPVVQKDHKHIGKPDENLKHVNEDVEAGEKYMLVSYVVKDWTQRIDASNPCGDKYTLDAMKEHLARHMSIDREKVTNKMLNKAQAYQQILLK